MATENEIKLWLTAILKQDNLNNLSVNILGNSEKGDGYIGDIVFVQASGTTKEELVKHYELVLKCSKRSQILRETALVRHAFWNEIYMYQQVLPSFIQLQQDRGLEDYVDSIPLCYGTFISKNTEILVFENLKTSGYYIWHKQKPMTINHINMIIREYAKYHATSVAMSIQQPKKFQEYISNLGDIYKKFNKSFNMDQIIRNCIDEVCDLLKNELDDNILQRWKNLKNETTYILEEMAKNTDDLQVILHGDCWNNNYMFKHENEKTLPTKVAILDWQQARYSSPILDLSYFLFTCVSSDDLQELDEFLKMYHSQFTHYLTRLGSNSKAMYPQNQFMKDWKNYSKFGITMTSLIIKICFAEKGQGMELDECAEKGADFTELFMYEVKDKENMKKRMLSIVKYAAEHGLI